MTNTQPEMDWNILIKFINKYDGNREQLTAFISNCKSAINVASQTQQGILLKYIISQLEGKAQTACSIKEFETWQQLEDFLKSQFGERKHYAALLSDLQDCKQSNSETANQFALRVESCLSKLLTEINISIPTKKKGELAGRVAAMQDLALHTFVIGLNPRLSTIVRCRDPETLNDAINFAVSEEKIILATTRRNTSYVPHDNLPNQSRFRQIQNRSFPQQSSRPFNNNISTPTCRYCKAPGHTIDECRKREYNNRRYGRSQTKFFPAITQTPNAFPQRNPNVALHMLTSPEEHQYDNNLNDQAFPSGIVRES